MDLRGFLVRCHRLQRNYSQEGLCRGICAVSYLSKLEQGKVQAADEIYQALFHRLGIVFQENEEWLAVWKEKLQELASAWFYGEQREAYELEKQMENLLNIILFFKSTCIFLNDRHLRSVFPVFGGNCHEIAIPPRTRSPICTIDSVFL